MCTKRNKIITGTKQNQKTHQKKTRKKTKKAQNTTTKYYVVDNCGKIRVSAVLFKVLQLWFEDFFLFLGQKGPLSNPHDFPFVIFVFCFCLSFFFVNLFPMPCFLLTVTKYNHSWIAFAHWQSCTENMVSNSAASRLPASRVWWRWMHDCLFLHSWACNCTHSTIVFEVAALLKSFQQSPAKFNTICRRLKYSETHGALLIKTSTNSPACRGVWLEAVVLVSVLGLCLFLCSLAVRLCFIRIKSPLHPPFPPALPVFVLDRTLPIYSMNAEHSLHTLSRLKREI